MIRTIVVLILIAFACRVALGQEGHFGRGHEGWHQKFYKELAKPDNPSQSCCNLTDCRPTSGRQVGDHYEVKVSGVWVRVLPSKVVKRTAPDSGFHVCAPHGFTGLPEQIYCVVLAPEG